MARRLGSNQDIALAVSGRSQYGAFQLPEIDAVRVCRDAAKRLHHKVLSVVIELERRRIRLLAVVFGGAMLILSMMGTIRPSRTRVSHLGVMEPGERSTRTGELR